MSPVWNNDRGILTFDGQTVLILRQPAKNLRAILNAFQRQGWPSCIANPLEPDFDRDDRQRLANAVHALNGKKHKIPFIRFRRNGLGRIVWERLEEK